MSARIVFVCPLICGGLLLSCQSAHSPSLPLSASPMAAAQLAGGLTTPMASLGLFECRIDAAGAVAIEFVEARSAQQTDDLYDLSVDGFFNRQTLRATGVERGLDTVEVTLRVTHPFAAPTDLTASPSSRNRADLGIAARLLVMLDADPVTQTYFAVPDQVVANTGLLMNADGYWAPKDILALPQPLEATVFPYKLVVDEALDNRVGVSNGGSVTGNYDPTLGWTRSAMGSNRDGWTGYGVLHQGQSADLTLAFDIAALTALGSTPILLAPVAQYNDPRGGGSGFEKRGNRLPPATPDWTKFAYRMPHGALDVESVRLLATPDPLPSNTIAGTTLHLHIVDWDARATASVESNLSDEPTLSLVAAQEVGIPTVEAVLPSLGIGATALACVDDDTPFGDPALDLGDPGDPLYFTGLLTNPGVGSQPVGTTWGLIRVTDVEANQSWNDGWRVALAPNLAPLAANIPEPITYQQFAVEVVPGNLPPVPSGLTTPPLIPDGTSTTVTLAGLTDPENDSIQVSIDWDDDGTYTAVGTLPYSGGYPVPVTWDSLPYTYTYTGTAADNRTIPVRLFDGVNTVDVDLFATVVRCSPDTYTTGSNWTLPGSWPYYTIASSSDVPPADLATLRVPAGAGGGVIYAGFDSGKFDLFRSHLPTPGPGINERVSNFTGLGGKAGAQVEVDSTNRILFSLRSGGESRLGPPSALYPAGTGVESTIYYCEYTAGVPATSYSSISTGANRVLAVALDGEDNVYYIDTTHRLHRLVKASSPTPYAEDTTGGFPLDLTGASYGGGITPTGATPATRQKIHDFIIDWRSGAFFILAQSEETPTVAVKNGYLYRVNCDGSFPATIGGNANPRKIWLTDSSIQDRKADITIDQVDSTGAALTGTAASSQILVSAYIQVVAGAPELQFLDTNLSPLAQYEIPFNGQSPVAYNTDNMLSSGFIYWFTGYVDYIDTIGCRSTPISGWQ